MYMIPAKLPVNCATTCKMKNWCCTGNKTFNQIKQAAKRTWNIRLTPGMTVE